MRAGGCTNQNTNDTDERSTYLGEDGPRRFVVCIQHRGLVPQSKIAKYHLPEMSHHGFENFILPFELLFSRIYEFL